MSRGPGLCVHRQRACPQDPECGLFGGQCKWWAYMDVDFYDCVAPSVAFDYLDTVLVGEDLAVESTALYRRLMREKDQ